MSRFKIPLIKGGRSLMSCKNNRVVLIFLSFCREQPDKQSNNQQAYGTIYQVAERHLFSVQI